MKKSQLMSQPLIYIFALIVGALILIWGFKQIYQLKDIAESVSLNDFVTRLRKDVDSYYYLDEGSEKNIKILIPPQIEYLCFKNKTGQLKFPNFINKNERFIIQNTDKNLFFIPLDAFTKTSFNIPHLQINTRERVLCFKNAQTLRLISKETHVEAST